MARKVQNLSEVTARLTPDQLVGWGESCNAAGTVLNTLAALLQKRIETERKHMRLDQLTKTANPLNELLARQAKIEALEDLIDLIIDK